MDRKQNVRSRTRPRTLSKGVQIYLLLGQDGGWGPPAMQFGGIWRYFSTSRLPGWTGLWHIDKPMTNFAERKSKMADWQPFLILFYNYPEILHDW